MFSLSYSVGVMAYNEEKNVARLLDAIFSQQAPFSLHEVIVVASGCTDRTCEVVLEYRKREPRLSLLRQPRREGKASAINCFLKRVESELIVLESADTLPAPNAYAELLEPFQDRRVGAVGARVIPLNKRDSFLGFYTHLFWDLHHRLALQEPKCGELLAFRNALPGIAKDTATDETWIVALLSKMGYTTLYAPKATVYNMGPKTFPDLFRQRIRHMIGYYHLREQLSYFPKTMQILPTIRALLASSLFRERPLSALAVVFCEGALRVRAKLGYTLLSENPYIWPVAETTKELPPVSSLCS